MSENTKARIKVGAAGMLAALLATPALAQNFPITSDQRATAQQVAQTGVPLSELSPTAPDTYTVKSGDTLWAISGLFLRSAWRWPELWGMNLEDIRNPHRIYPGQQLFLDKSNGRATLRTRMAGGSAPTDTVRVSPRTRYESLADMALPTLKPNLIEPFLAEPMVVDESTLLSAPRVVAAPDDRVLISKGDRAYARGPDAAPMRVAQGQSRNWRVFRNAVPLRDPVTQEVLGYEAQYIGKAELVRGEATRETPGKDKTVTEIIPATIDIVATKEEIRAGDRLLPEPPRQLVSYTPRAPQGPMDATILSVYGSAVQFAAQNQVVVLNRGTRDGIESGHVLALVKSGAVVTDRDGDKRTQITLPDERNGLLMVFRPFERVSYALILEIRDGVRVGDRVINPR
ncbi:MAG: LysM peptidoglycan-binding domain-containing protein [Rubrivivax sp.]|nr:MAG: LysM peptidoglycan-binding domain-containing protein [Rubrivivax sp.]